jgi:hypothetical protein
MAKPDSFADRAASIFGALGGVSGAPSAWQLDTQQGFNPGAEDALDRGDTSEEEGEDPVPQPLPGAAGSDDEEAEANYRCEAAGLACNTGDQPFLHHACRQLFSSCCSSLACLHRICCWDYYFQVLDGCMLGSGSAPTMVAGQSQGPTEPHAAGVVEITLAFGCSIAVGGVGRDRGTCLSSSHVHMLVFRS